jgi:cell division protein ZapE
MWRRRRGKSMLMDLPYETVAPKQRSHFHAFMQWVHGAIADARKTGSRMSFSRRVIWRTCAVSGIDEMQISDITDAMIVGVCLRRFCRWSRVVTTNRVPDDLYKDEQAVLFFTIHQSA